jgi:hypothetical protein
VRRESKSASTPDIPRRTKNFELRDKPAEALPTETTPRRNMVGSHCRVMVSNLTIIQSSSPLGQWHGPQPLLHYSDVLHVHCAVFFSPNSSAGRIAYAVIGL